MRRLLLTVLLAGTAASAQPTPPGKLFVTATLHERMPGGATLTARLLSADTDATLGETSLPVGGRSGQVRFSLAYDAGRIEQGTGYVIIAEIRDDLGHGLAMTSPPSVGVRFTRRGRPTGRVRLTLVEWVIYLPEPAPAARPAPVEGPPSLPGPAPPPDMSVGNAAGGDLTNETWALTEVGPAGETARTVGPGERTTLTFRGSHVYSGEAGCARFSGRYETSESGGLTLSPATVSRAGCPADRPAPDPVLGILAGVTRYGRSETQLTLGGTAGFVAFQTDARPRSGMVIPEVDRLSEYACGDAGTFLLRTGRGDAEVWLSDALATRDVRGAPLGTYHILGQVPAPGDVARYAYGPLAAVVDGEGVQGETAGLEIGAERLRCTARPDPDMNVYGGRVNDLPDIQTEGPDGMVQIYGTASRAVYLSFWDGLSLFGSPATVTTLAPGVTEVRGEYGVVVTVTAGACADGRDRVRLSRPEGTSDGCRIVIE